MLTLHYIRPKFIQQTFHFLLHIPEIRPQLRAAQPFESPGVMIVARIRIRNNERKGIQLHAGVGGRKRRNPIALRMQVVLVIINARPTDIREKSHNLMPSTREFLHHAVRYRTAAGTPGACIGKQNSHYLPPSQLCSYLF